MRTPGSHPSFLGRLKLAKRAGALLPATRAQSQLALKNQFQSETKSQKKHPAQPQTQHP